ncbi:MAG TPA: (Fe-S)-binding protein, partial [Deltaproteobacteria bacterium]|nr:(Fe-S)-binding protein [Deltaproteobacteria bacterium]
MEPLTRIEKELKKCVKCGACRAHCPVFSVLGREPVTARGKIALARGVMTGTVPLDARTRADMSKCLLCGRCVEKCANDVPTDLIVLAAREVLARKRGLTPLSRMIRLLFGSGKLMNNCARLANVALPLLFRRIPASSGLRLRFPFRFFSGRRIPAMPRRPFLGRHPEVTEGRPDRPRVARVARDDGRLEVRDVQAEPDAQLERLARHEVEGDEGRVEAEVHARRDVGPRGEDDAVVRDLSGERSVAS